MQIYTKFFDKTKLFFYVFATLYGENLDLFFTDLAEAHRKLDEIVLGLYGLGKNASEAEMVGRLFEMINHL